MLKKLLLGFLIVAGLTIGLAGCLEEGEVPPPEQDEMMLDQPSEGF
jgi:hypothetical protein